MIPVFVAAGAAAIAIYTAVKAVSMYAEKEFEQKKTEYYNNITKLRNDIDEAKKGSFFFGYDFNLLVELHYQSCKQGDLAYKGKQAVRRTIDGYYTGVRQIKEKQQKLYIEMKNGTKTYAQRAEIAEQLAGLKDLKSHLYLSIDNAKKEQEKFLSNVMAFNAETHDLKIFIRNNCGRGGEVWYERLEERRVYRAYR